MSATDTATSPPAGTADPGTDVEAFVEWFAEGWRAPTSARSVYEHFVARLDPQVRLVQPQLPELVGHEQFRTGFVEPLFELMPDLHGEVENWAARGNVVYVQIALRGTMGGRPAAFASCDRITLRDGLMVERVAFMDPTPVLQAALASPRVWPAFARTQLRNLRLRAGRQS